MRRMYDAPLSRKEKLRAYVNGLFFRDAPMEEKANWSYQIPYSGGVFTTLAVGAIGAIFAIGAAAATLSKRFPAGAAPAADATFVPEGDACHRNAQVFRDETGGFFRQVTPAGCDLPRVPSAQNAPAQP